jgi:protein-tyrosine phosphatase
MDFNPKICPCVDCASRPEERKEKLTYNWVTPTLATGAAIPPSGYAELAAQGVTHIISCFEAIDDAAFAPEGVKVLWVPQPDDGKPRNSDDLRKIIEFAKSAGVDAKIYAHCHAGCNRGPLAAYLVLRVRGMGSSQAIDAIRKARPQVGFYRNDTYLESVERALEEKK